ncbi:MAG: hypothetical protein Q9M45_04315 [Robiginitomaculum sp.]|nr:hypothetical protein [Robiginitomaculum sp.]
MNRLRVMALIGTIITAAMHIPDVAYAQLQAAVLPTARSVGVGETASFFATVLNADTSFTEEMCTVTPGNGAPAGLQLDFQTTDASNALTGTLNAPFTVPGGGSQTLALFLKLDTPFSGRVKFRFRCNIEGRDRAPVIKGVNDVTLTVSATPKPDIVAIGQTLTGDGIARTDMNARLTPMSVAAINIGAGAMGVDVVFDLDGFDTFDGLNVFGCETDSLGTCISSFGNPLSVDFDANSVHTFSVFIETPDGYALPLDPEFIRFRTAFGVCPPADGGQTCTSQDDLMEVFGGTSTTAAAPDGLTGTPVSGVYELRGRTEGDVQDVLGITGEVVFSFAPDGQTLVATLPAIPPNLLPGGMNDGTVALGYMVNHDFAFAPFDQVLGLGCDISGPVPATCNAAIFETQDAPPQGDMGSIPLSPGATSETFELDAIEWGWPAQLTLDALGDFLENGRIRAVRKIAPPAMPVIPLDMAHIGDLDAALGGTFAEPIPGSSPFTFSVTGGTDGPNGFTANVAVDGDLNGVGFRAREAILDPSLDPRKVSVPLNQIVLFLTGIDINANGPQQAGKGGGKAAPQALGTVDIMFIADSFDAQGRVSRYRVVAVDQNGRGDTFEIVRQP